MSPYTVLSLYTIDLAGRLLDLGALYIVIVNTLYTVKKGVLMSTLINLSLSMRCSAAPRGVS